MRSRYSAVGRPGSHAGDEAAVFLQVVGLVDRVEGDRRVEVGEDDDEEDLADHVGPAVGAEEGGEVERGGGVEELADRRREGHDRGGEDDRDDAGHVDPQRQVGRAAGGHSAPDHAFRVLDRDPPLALLDEDDRDDHRQGDERHHHDEDLVGVVPPLAGSRSGCAEAIEAKIISEIPLPIPRWVISSPSHISRVQPAVRQITIRKTLAKVSVADDAGAGLVAEGAEEEDVAERLARRRGRRSGSACTG